MPASLEQWDLRLTSLFGLSMLGHPARLRDGLLAACDELGLADDESLLARVDRGDAEANVALARALTIGETYFFREPAHFDLLRETLLPDVITRSSGPVVLVSAACSSGEEAYSMAIVARMVLGAASPGRVRVLGIDVNDRSLAAARRGEYRPWALRDVADDVRERWFDRSSDAVSVKAEVRALTTFERRNLVDAADALAPASADIIFCRNVLIYLDEASVALVLTRLSEALRPGGFLIVASAEAGLFGSAGLGAREVGDVWVHAQGDRLPREPQVETRREPPVETRREPPDASVTPAISPPRAPRPPRPMAPARASSELQPTPQAAPQGDAARWLDEGWQILATDPVTAGEQARRAILLDRSLAAAHVLAASAALAQSDTRTARRSLRHARRCLAVIPAGEVVRGAGGATGAQMTSYCMRLERALEERGE